jgi:hypothetical protein
MDAFADQAISDPDPSGPFGPRLPGADPIAPMKKGKCAIARDPFMPPRAEIQELADRIRVQYITKGRPRQFKDEIDRILEYDPTE